MAKNERPPDPVRVTAEQLVRQLAVAHPHLMEWGEPLNDTVSIHINAERRLSSTSEGGYEVLVNDVEVRQGLR